VFQIVEGLTWLRLRKYSTASSPGDSLSRIAAKSGGTLLPIDRNQRLAKLIQLNPQIKNPDVIYPGELIRLGSVDGHLDPTSNFDLGEVRKVWKSLSRDTREIIQKNFDVLEWMARQKDRLDFLDNVSWQGKPLLEAVPEMNYGVIPAEYRRFRIALEELTAIRGNTISILQSLRISVVREPVFILIATSNGLYKYTQTLLKMVEWAEKVKLGEKLLFFEVGSEVVKVGATAAITKSGMETSNRRLEGLLKLHRAMAPDYWLRGFAQLQ